MNEVITAQERETVGSTKGAPLAPEQKRATGDYLVTLRVNESVQYFKLPSELKSERKKRIGSTWVKGTKDILRGLSEIEERRYLPKLIGIAPTSDSWDKTVREYWSNMTIDVPVTGIQLNIGTKEGIYLELNDSNKRVETKGIIPINLNDYIRYNFCLKHKWVAVSEEDLTNVDFFPYYIEDHKALKVEKQDAFQQRKKANLIFNRLLSPDNDGTIDEVKVDWILEVSKRNSKSAFYNRSYSQMSSVEKEMALENEKNVNPDVFIRITSDPDLEDKAFLGKLIEGGIVERSGNTYLDDGEILANSTKEFIVWLKNPVNSKRRITFEERLKGIST